MSGGRVELGLGTGWHDGEHAAYGIPFPPIGERFAMARGAARDRRPACGRRRSARRSTTTARHYTIKDSPALPKPVQNPIPVIVGGWGEKRTPRLAAQYATEFNLPFAPVELLRRARCERVRAACEAVGPRSRDDAHARSRRRCAADPTKPSSRAARRRSVRIPRACARTTSAASRARSSTASAPTARPAPTPSTSRCSTSPTTTTSASSRPRSHPMSEVRDGTREVRCPHGSAEHEPRASSRHCGSASRSSGSTGSASGTTSTRPTTPATLRVSRRLSATPRSQPRPERVRCGSLVYSRGLPAPGRARERDGDARRARRRSRHARPGRRLGAARVRRVRHPLPVGRHPAQDPRGEPRLHPRLARADRVPTSAASTSR